MSLTYTIVRSCGTEFFSSTSGVRMTIRTWSLPRWIPIMALIAAGCTEQAQPSSPAAKANLPALNQPRAKVEPSAAKVKKPKVIREMTGPTQLVD
jgi:hypothetical protein